VRWLGRVLAARGMPRFLLERHLEQLHEQLVAFVPERSESYAPLLRAAAELKSERTRVLGNAQHERFAAEFALSVMSAADNHALAPLEAGTLLVAAVIDEACGVPHAVDSLCLWLGDPARFPERFRSALNHTLHETRNSLPRAQTVANQDQ
jgi:hypothetical protein